MTYDIWAGAGISAVMFLVAWGGARVTIANLEKRVDKVEKTTDEFHDTYVAYAHFNEFVGGIKENYRDLKADIQRLFEAVSRNTGEK